MGYSHICYILMDILIELIVLAVVAIPVIVMWVVGICKVIDQLSD